MNKLLLMTSEEGHQDTVEVAIFQADDKRLPTRTPTPAEAQRNQGNGGGGANGSEV